jgi:enamine deaminase RidA (YjgF/YER057c/UK114 family)
VCCSQAVLINDTTLYISGALGIDPAVGDLVDGGVEAEARQALINIGHILSAANASYNNGSRWFFSFRLTLIVVLQSSRQLCYSLI